MQIYNLHPSYTFSTSLSCQRYKHVNSCDMVMRWESLPSTPIRAPVCPPAAPAWPHLPAIMNCQHRSLPHLYTPFSLFSSLWFTYFHFPSGFPHSETDILNNTAKISVVSENAKYGLTLSLRWGQRLKRQTGGDCEFSHKQWSLHSDFCADERKAKLAMTQNVHLKSMGRIIIILGLSPLLDV